MRNLIQLLILYSCAMAFGCVSFQAPTIKPVELCAISLQLDYSSDTDAVIDEMNKYWQASLRNDRVGMKKAKLEIFGLIGYCRCKLFDYSSGLELEDQGKSYPLARCADTIGNPRDQFLKDVQPYLKEVRRFHEDLDKKAKQIKKNSPQELSSIVQKNLDLWD